MKRVITCPVCGEKRDIMTHVHARSHGFPSKEALYEVHGIPEPEKVIKDASINADVSKWLRESNNGISEYDFRAYMPKKRK